MDENDGRDEYKYGFTKEQYDFVLGLVSENQMLRDERKQIFMSMKVDSRKRKDKIAVAVFILIALFALLYVRFDLQKVQDARLLNYYASLADPNILCDTTLYASNNGHKYHVESCRYVSRFCKEYLGESAAQDAGYTPCRICIQAEKQRVAEELSGFHLQ